MSAIHAAPAQIPDRLRQWLVATLEAAASDLHLVSGHPPVFRVHGELLEHPHAPLTAEELEPLLAALCPPNAFERLEAQKNVDFSFEMEHAGESTRFRANLFLVGGALGGCMRVIPSNIPDFEWAGFPRSLSDRLIGLRDGLVIVTGATGSGKTTTLAMIVNELNQQGGKRIITVEEPVEYLFPRAFNSVVSQREVGGDVLTFADGLKYGLRQDPDVILVGEIRDRETAQMALSAAETGHLVLTTLHTRDAKGAISRFADLFPQETQKNILSQLAMSLRAIVSQRLLPGPEAGAKRSLALEALFNTHPIAVAIRQGKIEMIDNCIVTGRNDGMMTFDESIWQLLSAGLITRTTAEKNVSDVSMLRR